MPPVLHITTTEQLNSTAHNSRKRRTIDWPHEFAPDNALSLDYDKLDFPDFVTGFLSMVKPHETSKRNAMLDFLELLMLKASSYSWPGVHAFHSHITKQIELSHLEWMSCQEIRDKTVTFFKHSDLRSSQTKTSSGALSMTSPSSYSQPRSPSTSKPEVDRACCQWNYYGSCSCCKTNLDAFNAHHKCHVCTKDHPMLHCPKRRNPIPPTPTTSM